MDPIYVIVPPSTDVYFPPATGAAAITYDLTLTASVNQSTMGSISAGALVTFILRQNGIGGWTMTWPTTVINPPTLINPAPGGITIVQMVGAADAKLRPLSGGTYA